MTYPKRLLEDQNASFESVLLRSAQADAGSERAFKRAMGVWASFGVQLAAGTGGAAVASGALGAATGAASTAVATGTNGFGAGAPSAAGGVGSGAAVATNVAALQAGVGVAAGAGSAATASSLAGVATAGVAAVAGKWVGIGLVAGAVGVGAIHTVETSGPRAAPVSSAVAPPETHSAPLPSTQRRRDMGAAIGSAPARRSTPREAAPEQHRATAAEASRRALATPLAGSVRSNQRPVTGLPSSATTAAGALSAELRPLDRARQALRSGEPHVALRALAEHQQRFPGGALWKEAVLLEVEARLEASEVVRARTVAQRVMAVDPTGPYAARLRALFANRGHASP